MFTLFFTIIFIAEVIIAIWLILFIHKLNKKICRANNSILELQPILKDKVCKLKITINTVYLGIDYFAEFITRKKEQCSTALSNNIVVLILFLLLNTSGKRILAFIDLFMAFKKFIKTH